MPSVAGDSTVGESPIGAGAEGLSHTNPIGTSLVPMDPSLQVPVKKKRGRPKKIRVDGVVAIQTAPKPAEASTSAHDITDGPPKKKRGRPKKIRNDGTLNPPSSIPHPNMNGISSNGGTSHSGENGLSSASPAPSYMSHLVNNNQQNHHHPMEYYGRSPGPSGGGPFSGLCNDESPHQSHCSPQSSNPSPPRRLDTMYVTVNLVLLLLILLYDFIFHHIAAAETCRLRRRQRRLPRKGRLKCTVKCVALALKSSAEREIQRDRNKVDLSMWRRSRRDTDLPHQLEPYSIRATIR